MEEIKNNVDYKYIENKKVSPIITPLLENIIKGDEYISKKKNYLF